MVSKPDNPSASQQSQSRGGPFSSAMSKDNGLDDMTDTRPRKANGQGMAATSLDKVVIRGAFTLTEDGELQIGGNVEGNIKCQAMHVLDGGTMSGDVNADSIVVKGTYNGNITTNHFTLASKAKVVSNDILVYDTVVIEPDCHFEGQLRRPNAQEAKDARKASEAERTEESKKTTGNGSRTVG